MPADFTREHLEQVSAAAMHRGLASTSMRPI